MKSHHEEKKSVHTEQLGLEIISIIQIYENPHFLWSTAGASEGSAPILF